jgi:polyhydroxyalkanoate synthesis regulator phasin
MAQNDTFKRYLDAGMAFTQLSRERAEEFVNQLVKAGEVRRKETEEVIESLLERSRKNTEDLVSLIRREVADQLRNLGLEDVVRRMGLPEKGAVADAAEKVDIAADQVADVVDAPAKPAAKKAAAKKAAAKKAVPSPGSPLIVPGAPAAKKTAKKLVVPGAAAAKKAPAKKSTKKS